MCVDGVCQERVPDPGKVVAIELIPLTRHHFDQLSYLDSEYRHQMRGPLTTYSLIYLAIHLAVQHRMDETAYAPREEASRGHE